MSGPLQNTVEQAYAELTRQRAALVEIQRELAAAELTVTAKNRAVAVTVDSRGTATGIRFPTGAFRSMAAAELGQLLVETISAARDQMMARTVEQFQELLPAGMPMLDLLTATGDAGGELPDLDEIVRTALRTAGDTQTEGEVRR